jgi:hypothetical protein
MVGSSSGSDFAPTITILLGLLCTLHVHSDHMHRFWLLPQRPVLHICNPHPLWEVKIRIGCLPSAFQSSNQILLALQNQEQQYEG